LRRRGPDDEGFYEAPGVGFSFRRLSIIDVAGGHQPLSNEDGTVWVMLNGEIYGYATVRDQLASRGHRFATKSDTEVIAHAYEEWGDGCFEKLNGMFAIAIWDSKRSRLLLARDRLGKKPLYWTERQGAVWFGSELKSLLAAGVVSKELDLVSMGMFFRTDYVPTPRSIFANVHKIEPASVKSWTVDQGIGKATREKEWSFWKPTPQNFSGITEEHAVRGLRERLDVAVKERLVSDVPLGLFLSGGLDSAVVAESAARQSVQTLKAFTIGFEDRSHDERAPAQQVAAALGLEFHEEVLHESDALALLDDATAPLDEPLADAAILPQLALARFTRSELTVALSGDGGDELLLGYQHIPAHLLINKTQWIPKVARQVAAFALRSIPAGSGYFSVGFKTQRMARGLTQPDPWSRDLAWRGSWTESDLDSLFLPDIRIATDIGSADRFMSLRAEEIDQPDFWKQWTWMYLRTFLMDDVLVKVDRATMWHSLESRAPILDTRVVEYLMALPDRLKLGAWKGKRLFKELLKDKLPSEILDRPKHGFGVPTAAWLKRALAPQLAEFMGTDFLRTQGLFNPEVINRIVKEHETGRVDRRKELWSYLAFQRWYAMWMK
jgi:asparagine synthase (glutamine-hydrolysing)